MILQNIRYKYLSSKDRRHIIGRLEVGPTPFLCSVATILGGGNISDSGLDKITRDGVDLAINQSFQPDVEIRNIIFELPKSPKVDDKTTISINKSNEYLYYLDKMKKSGTKLYYRPSRRDAINGMFEQYGYLADYYSYEQRFYINNMAILENLKKKNNHPTPFYRYSIFLAVWWAVASGCKEIHLYGVELPHNLNEDGVGFGHKTLNIVNGDNSYTLLYKLWIDLLKVGIKIKMDNKGALANLTGPI